MNYDTFEQAFRTNTASCSRICECGVEYYDVENDWSWEDGELEALKSNPKAVPVDGPVGTISFGGKECVIDCHCWRERAMRFMQFIDSHAHRIAAYLNGEKERLENEAKQMPVVEAPDFPPNKEPATKNPMSRVLDL